MTAPKLLEVNDIEIAFGNASPVVSGVNFAIERGQTLGIIGESGSGKSVSCSALTGLLPASARVTGEVWLDGEQLLGAHPGVLRAVRRNQVGMVFQDPVAALDPAMRIGDQVAEPLRLFNGVTRAEGRRIARQLLDEVGIANAGQRLDQYPHQFSGGMCQRVMIAMALVMEPALLIADEPTSALDVQTQEQVLSLFAQIQRERNIGIILVSHDLNVVAARADQVVVMRRGVAVESGPVKALFDRPQHAYTQALVAAVPDGPKPEPSVCADEGADNGEPPLLRIEGLGVTYRLPAQQGFRALDDVSLTLRAGEVLGLVGESGSGKTTLTRCLVGLERADSGQATLDNVSLLSLYGHQDRRLRKRVQVVFQDPWGSLSPRMTVQQIIAEPLRVHGLVESAQQVRKRVAALLREVGLDADVADRFPHQFSGGQRQRIAIARAIACEPELLIADEMVSALDVTVQARILTLLLDLVRARGLAVLFISHDLAVVRQVSDRVVVLKQGQVVEAGETERMMRAPQHPYTRALVSLARVDPMVAGR